MICDIELATPNYVASPGSIPLNVVAIDPIIIEPVEAPRTIFNQSKTQL